MKSAAVAPDGAAEPARSADAPDGAAEPARSAIAPVMLPRMAAKASEPITTTTAVNTFSNRVSGPTYGVFTSAVSDQ